MSVVVFVIYASCAGYGVCKSFFAKLLLTKRIFGELIVFQHLNMDFTIFLNVILSNLSKLSLSSEIHAVLPSLNLYLQ